MSRIGASPRREPTAAPRRAALLLALAVVAPAHARGTETTDGGSADPAAARAGAEEEAAGGERGSAPGERSGWYLGLGVGVGTGRGKSLERTTFGNMLPWPGLALRMGRALSPRFLFGAELMSVLGTSDPQGVFTGLNAVVTFFPSERGLFVRGGAGLALVPRSAGYDTFAIRLNPGIGALAGAGWAFWIRDRLSLTLNADLCGQLYSASPGDPRSVYFGLLSIGLDWF